MKIIKNKIIIFFMIIFPMISFCGCWDYSEMDDFKHVAGIAIDKDKYKDEYILTIEVLETFMDSKQLKSKIVQSRGKTIHTALRDAIKKTGNMLRLSHAKVVIINRDIAREGIVHVIDLINRDVEVRNDMWIVVATENLGSEILNKSKNEEQIISYDIEHSIKNYNKIGKYIGIETFKLIDILSYEGICPTLPMIKLGTKNGELGYEVYGTAIFKGEKMIGELTEEETMILQFFNGKDLEFVLLIQIDENEIISFEILKSKRKIKVNLKENKISMDTYINIDVAISELATSSGVNYINKDERNNLKNLAEESIKNNCYLLIEKLEKQYKSDVIGFGRELKKKKPKEWKKISSKWDEIFEFLEVNIFVNIDIKYSGLTDKNIEIKNK
ncbi:Ger(x)C family spore germination protein [Clostridium cochlearium]|uniref:Ger(x)C family spore germination protein n=1 Tax=Clostridium cochlearium TaxID=1494 RepID=UPI00156D4065|nr:Ger(x)C family spore germination protein [Clostridium cochlearium]MBV1820977.1 Ger(x)C family spore germination protein [Bacteroidales bacterium MSK.15.36]MCG4581216.1 Ger(x)C family spore germination protein [Clostridium cochlearium]NSJ91667.1 Ger(x)C family spore germination protein [Coprococcus sp. MSK.21.13]